MCMMGFRGSGMEVGWSDSRGLHNRSGFRLYKAQLDNHRGNQGDTLYGKGFTDSLHLVR